MWQGKKKTLLGCLIAVTAMSLMVNIIMLSERQGLMRKLSSVESTISAQKQNFQMMSSLWIKRMESLSKRLDEYHKHERQHDEMIASWPLKEQSYITSAQGRRLNPFTLKGFQQHHGADISTRSWRPEILSPVDGTIVTHYPPPGGKWKGHKVYGGMIEIEDRYGRTWLLAHLSETYDEVHEGFHVRAGQPLGRMGSTGQSTYAHLHVGLKDRNGRELQVLDWLDYDFINPTGWVYRPDEGASIAWLAQNEALN